MSVISATEEVRESWSEPGLDKILRSYLETNKKAKRLEAWLSGGELVL
jgi:hypothetical protein